MNHLKQILLIVLLLLLLHSCDLIRKGMDVSIHNDTSYTIYNVTVSANADTFVTFDSISPNQEIIKFLNMKDMPKTDGAYKLIFTYPDGEEVNKTFGYYSNGWPDNEYMCCTISKRGTMTKFDRFCNE